MNATLHFFIQNTVFASAAYFVFRLFVTKFFDAGIKKYESDLSQNVEAHKSQLSQIALEHKVRFERLHHKKEEIMIRLYEETCKCEDSLTYLTSIARGIGSPDDKYKVVETYDDIVEFSKSIRSAKLYFEPQFSVKFEELLSLSYSVFFGMKGVELGDAEIQRKVKLYNHGIGSRVRVDVAMKPIEEREYYRSKIEVDFKDIREDIVNEFRGITLEGRTKDVL
jgi:hypothetical protein